MNKSKLVNRVHLINLEKEVRRIIDQVDRQGHPICTVVDEGVEIVEITFTPRSNQPR